MKARKSEIEQKLKEYFEKCSDVLMAFVFGSQAKGTARALSDWDIAVYLREEDRNREQALWTDVEHIVGAEIDLIILNRAPAALSWTIIRTGTVLVIKDRGLYLSFMLRASHEANDWYYTTEKYHRAFARSASLSLEDRGRLERVVQFLTREVSDFDTFRALTWQEYERDRAKKREVERWAEQIMNAVIDVAEIILASERRVMPETYRLIVQALGSVPPFDREDLCEKLAAVTGLRNVLAHEYLDYRWKELFRFIQESRPLIDAFLERVKVFLEKQG